MTAAFSRQKRMFISFFDDMTLWNRSKTRVYFDKITSDALKIKPNSVVSYYCTIVNGWIFNASDVKSKIGQVKSNWPLENFLYLISFGDLTMAGQKSKKFDF